MRSSLHTVLVVTASACQPSPVPAPSAPVCLAADDSSARTLVRLETLAASDDSTEAAIRDSLRLPRAAPSSVALVRDEATCRRALRAFNDIQETPGQERRLQVYGVGALFVVEAPGLEGWGEYRALRIFDEHWRYRSTLAAF